MDVQAGVLQAAGALREAPRSDRHVLADPAAAKALLDVIPAEAATLNELDIAGQRSAADIELIDEDYPEEPFRQFWDHFWNSLTCSYTEAIPRLRTEVMGTADFYSDRQWHSTGIYTEVLHPAGVEKELLIPLPASPGIARRLVFFRGPGAPFTDDERGAAILLQPHISRALHRQARLRAARLLTDRQAEILQLVAAGQDNAAIARRRAIPRHRTQAPGKHLRQTRSLQPHHRRSPRLPRHHVGLAPSFTGRISPSGSGVLVTEGAPEYSIYAQSSEFSKARAAARSCSVTDQDARALELQSRCVTIAGRGRRAIRCSYFSSRPFLRSSGN